MKSAQLPKRQDTPRNNKKDKKMANGDKKDTKLDKVQVNSDKSKEKM